MATLESTAFLALGFGAVKGQDFRTRRDPLGRFTLFLISQLVSGSRVSLTQGRAVVVEARARGQSFWASATKKCEEIPCRDVHLARCLQFAMHKFRLSLFVKDLEPGGSTTFCFSIV